MSRVRVQRCGAAISLVLRLTGGDGDPGKSRARAARGAVLDANPGGIHRLWEFEQALCAAGVCCAAIRTMPPLDCPDGYSDDGESCSQDGHIIHEP